MSENRKNFLKALFYSYGIITAIYFGYFLLDSISHSRVNNEFLGIFTIPFLMPIIFIIYMLLATFFLNPLYAVLLIAYFGAFILLFKSQQEMKENTKIRLLTVLMILIHLMSGVILMGIMPSFIV